MKRIMSLFLCLLMVLTLTIPAFATEGGAVGSGAVVGPIEPPAPPAEPTTPPTQPTNPPTTAPTQPPECTDHTWNGGTVSTAATCKTEGTMLYTCTVCGKTKTETIAATGIHTYGSWQNADSANHKRVCTGCGLEETAAHAFDGGTVDKAPTCKEEGVKVYRCACGASKSETLAVDANAHTYGSWTLTESSHSRSCSACGKVDSGSHNWAVSKETKPTCKAEGSRESVCTVCKGVLKEKLAKLTTHTYKNACDPDCNVCGEKRTIQHDFNKAWSRDSWEHWHVCKVCGEKTDVARHIPGPAATEEKAQTCLTCDLILMPKLEHVHKYEKDWSSDRNGHWHACTGCDNEKDMAEHTFDGPCDPDCNVCGYETDTAHSFGKKWVSDEKGHWHVCENCGENSKAEAHTPDPNAGEYDAVLCTVCDYEISPAVEHVHVFTEDWLKDDMSHWKQCECGETEDLAPHSWDEGTKDGDTITYRCAECGAEQVEVVEKAGLPGWVLPVLLGLIVVLIIVIVIVLLIPSDKFKGKYHG